MLKLQDLMISKVRVLVLQLFFTNPKEKYYVREMSRLIKVEINALRRELERLLNCGLLRKEERGNRIYYFLNPRYIFYQELERMIAKTTGLGAAILKYRRKLGTIVYASLSSKYVKKELPYQDEVDAFFVGNVVLPELDLIMKKFEKDAGRELNYTVFSKDEFEFRKTRRDPFIMNVLYNVRVMIIGDEAEFIKIKRDFI